MQLTERSCIQLRLITKVISMGCLLSIALSYKLWLSERPFPLSPLLNAFPAIPPPLDLLILLLAGISLLLILILQRPQRLIFSFLILAVFLAFTDQNRWQPWFYQYGLMFLVVSLSDFHCADPLRQRSAVLTLQIMIAAVYFWSGLQKMNPRFLSDTFPWLMEPFTSRLGYTPSFFNAMAYSFPFIEAATGVLLLLPRGRRPALILAILMHCFILLILSPFGHNYNPVVWPWNIAMILFNLILFRNSMFLRLADLKQAFHFHRIKITLILFVLMPLFNFFNTWDSYLSHNLYSGNTSNGVIYVSEEVKNALPEHIKKYALGEPGQSQITIKYWCMKELGVPAYPERRNFLSVASTLYPYASDSSEIYLLYTPKLSINGNK